MMRRVWRIIFKKNTETPIDVEAVNVVEASNIATAFLQDRGYNYDSSDIIEAKICAEPITVQQTKVTEGSS